MHHPIPYEHNTRSRRRKNTRLNVVQRFFKILLIASLYFKFKGCPEPDYRLLHQLNDKFKLVCRVDALWIPTALASVLWRKFDSVDFILRVKTGKMTIAQAKREVAEHVPYFAHYEGMIDDIARVMTEIIEVA